MNLRIVRSPAGRKPAITNNVRDDDESFISRHFLTIALFVAVAILTVRQLQMTRLDIYFPPEYYDVFFAPTHIVLRPTPLGEFVEPQCTEEQAEQQSNLACEHWYKARNNLEPYYPLLRKYLPDAQTLVDVGANKGLVSARWLELWRPKLQVTVQNLVKTVVRPTFKANNLKESPCGKINMCKEVDHRDRAYMRAAPIPLLTGSDDEFCVHSFEPSVELVEMHTRSRASNFSRYSKPEVKKAWKWHRMALSSYNAEIGFLSGWREDNHIRGATSLPTVKTRVATLDALAYDDRLFGGDKGDAKAALPRLLDIVKIDVEFVDLEVLQGASQLLADKRIRVIMWEMPNQYPAVFEAMNNTVVKNFGELFNFLNEKAGMTCYFPGKRNKFFKITGTLLSYERECQDFESRVVAHMASSPIKSQVVTTVCITCSANFCIPTPFVYSVNWRCSSTLLWKKWP